MDAMALRSNKNSNIKSKPMFTHRETTYVRELIAGLGALKYVPYSLREHSFIRISVSLCVPDPTRITWLWTKGCAGKLVKSFTVMCTLFNVQRKCILVALIVSRI